MAKKQKQSLEQWFQDNDREDLLREWDGEKNFKSRFPMAPDTTEYFTALSAWWKCSEWHEWQAPVQKRTTFGLGCPICHPEQTYIPVGTKYGCLTVLSVTPVDETDRYSRIYGPTYNCVCDCGKKISKSEFHFIEKKHRYCTETIRRNRNDRWAFAECDKANECDLKTAQEEKKKATYKRILDESYDLAWLARFMNPLKWWNVSTITMRSFGIYPTCEKRRRHLLHI